MTSRTASQFSALQGNISAYRLPSHNTNASALSPSSLKRNEQLACASFTRVVLSAVRICICMYIRSRWSLHDSGDIFFLGATWWKRTSSSLGGRQWRAGSSYGNHSPPRDFNHLYFVLTHHRNRGFGKVPFLRFPGSRWQFPGIHFFSLRLPLWLQCKEYKSSLSVCFSVEVMINNLCLWTASSSVWGRRSPYLRWTFMIAKFLLRAKER